MGWPGCVGRHPVRERVDLGTVIRETAIRTCDIEDRTISTAFEAYWSQNQVEPTGRDDLVPDLLREQPDSWGLEVDADGFLSPVPVPGGRCDPVVLGS